MKQLQRFTFSPLWLCLSLSLCQELYTKASHALAELVTKLFLQTLPVVTGLSVRECELLKEEWQENMVPQLEKWETHHQKRWKLYQEQLLQEKKVRPILCPGTPGSESRDMEKKILKYLSMRSILCINTQPKCRHKSRLEMGSLTCGIECCACRLAQKSQPVITEHLSSAFDSFVST